VVEERRQHQVGSRLLVRKSGYALVVLIQPGAGAMVAELPAVYSAWNGGLLTAC